MTMRLLAVAALAAGLWAQNQPAAPAQPAAQRLEALKTYLGLSDTQIQTLVDARKGQMEAMRADLREIAAKRRELRQKLAAGNPNAPEVGALMVEIRELQKKAAEKRRATDASALGVLSADQKTRLAALADAQKLLPAMRQAAAVGLLEGPAQPVGPRGELGRGMRMKRQGMRPQRMM